MSKATTVDIPIEGQSIRYTLPLLFSPRFEKVLFNREDIQIYFGGAGCYPKGTEFMTPAGWKKIEDYTQSDLVLQVDKTLQASFVKPLGYIKKQVDQFNRIKNRGCDFTTSLDHKHLVQTEKKIVKTVTTKELISGHSKTRGNKMSFYSTFNYDGQGIAYSDDYIRLKIAVLADGHFPNKINNECYFNIKKPRKVKRIKDLLLSNGIEYTNQKGADGYTRIRFTMDNKEKVFESYWYQANAAQMEIITEEVLLWDDSDIERADRVSVASFSSTSKKSADFVQFAFSSAGVKASISEDNRPEKYRGGICYSVGLSRKHTMVGISKDPRHSNTTTIEKVDSEDGLMYCFTVPTGFFLVRQKGRIYVSGNSGKSVTLARRTILDMMMGQRNFLIIRKVYGTLKDSFYTELLKAIADLGLSSYFHTTKSPLEIIHKASGKKILFRGLDDKEKIKSITGEVGAITDILIEEATEITEEDFDMLDTRLRGFADVKKRITILFNPINKEHWIYDRFFSGRFADGSIEESYSIPVSYSMLDDDGQIVQINAFKTVHIHKSTHKDNKFLLPEDHARYEAFKETNKYYYDVYCLGNWGVLGDLIFTNYKIADLTEVAKRFNKIYFGLDYGYSPDPSALTAVAISGNTIYILKEWRGNRLNAVGVYNEIKDIVGKNTVICDRDEKMKDELSSLGLNIKMVVKYQGGIGSSILHNIQWFQGYKIMIDYRCKNYISEIGSYVRDKDRNGKTIPMPVAGNDHQLDSSYYALNDLIRTIKPMRAL